MPAEATGHSDQVEWVSVSELLLDSNNPRLDLDGTEEQDTLVEILWREYAVDEIALSIAENSFFEHEPLFAAREKGKLVVIEGNRRLAALKLLLDAELRRKVKASRLPRLSKAECAAIQKVPVVVTTRAALWQFLGFRHINGPQAWTSESKSKYVAYVHNSLGVQLEKIGRTIGDTHRTVQRLYAANMVLDQAEQAGVWKKEDRWRKHFSFSHLYTGLAYKGIQKHIGYSEKRASKKNPIPAAKTASLGELLEWLYGSKSREREPVIRTQNPDLRKLDEAIQDENGVTALRRGLPLEVSLDIARGDVRLFRESIQSSKHALQRCLGTVVSGYLGEGDLLETANLIVKLSTKLVREMEAIRTDTNDRKR